MSGRGVTPFQHNPVTEGSAMRLAILDDYQGVALSSADWGSLAPVVETTATPESLLYELCPQPDSSESANPPRRRAR